MILNRASKKLQDKGIKKELADKMVLNMAKATATPENNAQVHKILSNATSPLVYPNGDVEQGAQAFKASVDKARSPDRETTRKMYEVAERTEQKALAAGYDTDSAALLGNLEQSRANSVLNVAGLKPGEFEMTEVDFENAPVQDNTEAVQAAVAAQREQWKREYEEQQARKAQEQATANEEFDRKLAEANLQPEDILFQSAAMYKNKANSLAEFKDFAVNNKGNEQEDNKSFYRFTNKDGVQIDVPFERALHIKEKHHLTDQQLDVAEKELNKAEYAVLMPDVGEYQGKQVKIKVNTSLGKMGAVLEILPNGRVFLDTAFFDSDANIDNWAKENHPNAPSKKPVFIGGGTISIADIMREIKGNKSGTFDSANPNIYLQEDITEVDLTAPFADIAKLPADQRAQQVESSLNALIGQAMDTATPPLQIQITADNKVHIKNSNVKLKNGKLKRHQTALTTLEKIVNAAQKTDRKGEVDASHNTSKKTLAHKANVEEYVYFQAPVKIGEDTFLVELATERVKGQDKNLLDLYNVRVKRNPTAAHLSTLPQGSSTDRITNNEAFVKAQESANPNIYLKENIENVRPSIADIFGADAQTTVQFKENVKTVLSDENISNKQQVEMGQLPPLYTELGLPQQDLKTNKLALRKALGLLTPQELAEHKDWHNHNVPQETIDNLPALLSDPVAVLRSNTKNGSFVAVLDSEVQGKPVVAIVSPNPRKGGYTFIPSVYERNNYETFLKTTAEKGNLLYWDKNRMSLPGALTQAAIIGNDIPIDNITTKEDVVKAQEGVNPEEITEIHDQQTGETIPLEMNLNIKPFKPVELKSEVLPRVENAREAKRQIVNSIFGEKQQIIISNDGKNFTVSRSAVKKMFNTAMKDAMDIAAHNHLTLEQRRELYHEASEQVLQALRVFETAQLILSHKDVKNVPGRVIHRYGNVFNYKGKPYLAMFVNKEDGSFSTIHLYDLQTEENKYTAGISGVINNPSQQRYTNSIDEMVRFVKRKIAKYNNNVSGKQKVFNQGEARGSVTLNERAHEAIIRVFNQADPSTVVHELAHIYLTMINQAARVSADPEFAIFLKDLTAWLGEPGENGEYSRAQQETFARGFEGYLAEGKAPNKELEGVFAKFARWLAEVYEGVKDYLQISPEVRRVFDRLLAPEETISRSRVGDKIEAAKQLVEKIKRGQGPEIDGLTVADMKALLKTISTRKPKRPANHLLKDLRKYGAEYGNAGQIDKEAYKNARVYDKKGGIDDRPDVWLQKMGYMDFEDTTPETLQAAYDLVQKALDGEEVYRLEDQAQAENAQAYEENLNTVLQVFPDIKTAKETLSAIATLEQNGYRAVDKKDLTDLTQLVNVLGRMAAKLESEEIKAKEGALGEKANKIEEDAKRLKKRLMDELDKRQLENKEPMKNLLRAAKSTEDIHLAATALLDQLEKAWENTNEGKAEKALLAAPNTNWDKVRVDLLKRFNEIIGQTGEEVKAAQKVLNDLNGRILSEQQAQAKEKAEAVLKKANLEGRYVRAMEDAVRGLPHIYPADVRKKIAVLARSQRRFRLLNDKSITDFIGDVKKIQEANYKKYMSGKLGQLFSRKVYEKVGSAKRSKYSLLAKQFIEDGAQIWHLSEADLQTRYKEVIEHLDPNNAPDPWTALLNSVLALRAAPSLVPMKRFEEIYETALSAVRGDAQAKRLEILIANTRESQLRQAVLRALEKRQIPLGTVAYLLRGGTDFQTMLSVLFGKGKFDKYENSAKNNSKLKNNLSQNAKSVSSIRTTFVGNMPDIKEQMFAWYQKNLQGRKVTNPTLGEVLFSRKGISEVEGKALNETKAQFVMALWNIIEKGEVVGESAATHTPNIKKFYFIQAKIELDGNPKIVQADIAEDRYGKKFYYLSDIKENLREETRSHNPSVSKATNSIANTEPVFKGAPTLEDYKNPSRDFVLPAVPAEITAQLGVENKPVLLKKNIIEKNKLHHKELPLEDYNGILERGLYTPNLVLQTNPQERPNYFNFIFEGKDKSDNVVVEIATGKDNAEVVSFYRLDKDKLDKKIKRTNRNGGQAVKTHMRGPSPIRTPSVDSTNSIANTEPVFKGGREQYEIDFRKELSPEGEQMQAAVFDFNAKKAIFKAALDAYGLETADQVLAKMYELQNDKMQITNYGWVKDEQEGDLVDGVWDNGVYYTSNRPRVQTITREELITFWLWSQDHEIVEGKDGKAQDLGLCGRLLRAYGKDQLNAMLDKLSPQDKQYGRNLQKILADVHAMESEAHQRIYGFPLPQKENYFPSVTERITDAIDYKQQFIDNAKAPSFIKSRTLSKMPVQAICSPTQLVLTHMKRASEFIFEAEKYTRLRRIFLQSDVESAFWAKFGQSDGKKLFDKLKDLIAQQGPAAPKPHGELWAMSSKLLNGWVKSALGLKVMTGVKQFASCVSFAEVMPADKWLKYFAYGLAHPMETAQYMKAQSPYIEVRYETGGLNESVARAMAQDELAPIKTKWNNLTNLLLLNTRMGDKASLIFGGYPYMRYLQEQGISAQEAARLFELQAVRTLQSSLKANLSVGQANGDDMGARLFMLFKNQQLQYVRRLADVYVQYKNGEVPLRQLGKTALLYLAVNPLVYVMLGIGWPSADDDDREKDYFRLASAPVTQFFDAWPFGGGVSEFLLENTCNVIRGKKLASASQLGLPMLEDFVRDINRAIKTVNQDDIPATEAVAAWLEFAKYFGVPFGTLTNMATGAKDLVTGHPVRGALKELGFSKNRAGKITGEKE